MFTLGYGVVRAVKDRNGRASSTPTSNSQTVQTCPKCRRDLRTADFASACPELVFRISDAFGLRCLKRCPKVSSDITNRRSGRERGPLIFSAAFGNTVPSHLQLTAHRR